MSYRTAEPSELEIKSYAYHERYSEENNNSLVKPKTKKTVGKIEENKFNHKKFKK